MKTLKKFISSVIAVYVFVCGFMYVEQRSFMYHPDTKRPDRSAFKANEAEIVTVKTQDGLELEGWYFAPSAPDRPVIVVFHGNAGHYGHRFYKMRSYINAGYGVLLTEYRGYGGNAGSPSEQGFYKDARSFLTWLKEEKSTLSQQIVFYGESIGTGVAVQMAVEEDVAGVILEAPYSSTVDIAKNVYFILPINLLMKDKFLSIEKIDNVSEPLLIIHGAKDSVIPIKLSKKLFDQANDPKKFIEVSDAGHNDLYQFGVSRDVFNFLRSLEK